MFYFLRDIINDGEVNWGILYFIIRLDCRFDG